jgi:hypothetical protein
MARTFLRQDTQVRNSDVYSDAIAPTEADFETNPTNIETDLNNMRSQLHNLLKDQAGNWWDDLNVPSTLETGTQRGVNDLNTSLHAVEKKRVLRCVQLLADVAVPAALAATETLTLTGNAANTETVTIDGKVYTFQTVLTNVDGNVLIGASASDSIDNLIAAMNLAAGAGSLYAAATTIGTYSGAAGAGDTLDISSIILGTQSNGDALAEGLAAGSWGAGTTSGGVGDVVILGAGELPGNTTAAVGAVTTLGTVVAFEAAFGTISLAEVAGSITLGPKNLLEIVDGATGDPILSTEGKKVWGLLQSETAGDGHTITDTTTTRVQISFVHANATNDDLIFADGADIGGKTINYCYVERVRFEDLIEGDFLNTAAIDIGAGSATVTRKIGYDNQGTTPVELATNADLDLATGIEWSIRDNLDADLFQVIEGSGGSNSEVFIAPGTDTFRSDAVANDFDNGGSFDTGAAGTTINVGVTANQIDSGGELNIVSTAADLDLRAGAELVLDDSYRSASTWSLDGIRLADTTAEWDAFELEFGEVSLLNAITQALTTSDIVKTCANVTSTTGADTDVGGSGGGTNLDAQLNDMSAGSFEGDHDVFLNGQLLRGGASAATNNDYYPGTSLALGQLRFEFIVKINDVLCVISRT